MILASKLRKPALNFELIKRKKLYEQISEKKKLTLISAPAGFGKTTLICQWLSSKKCNATWFSIDKSDNDFRTFFSYVVASLRTIEPKIGMKTQGILQSTKSISPEQIVDILIQEILSTKNNYTLIFDDYHQITNEKIHRAIDFFLDHIQNLHLVILTRTDLPFSISRLRLEGEITEIREENLRFSKLEIKYLLPKGKTQDQDQEKEINELMHYTEGWIVPIRLFSLSKKKLLFSRSFQF